MSSLDENNASNINSTDTSSTNLKSIDQQTEIKMNANKKSANDFIFCKLIGEGSFSMVYVGKDAQTEKEYAIKVCDKALIRKERKQNAIMREKQIMNMIHNEQILKDHNLHQSPFFIKLYCTFQDANRLYFVMNYAKNGELLYYIKKTFEGSFDENAVLFYSGEILLAIEHLHKLGIVHRDLKPENILLNESMHIQITDFGSAFIINNQSSTNASSSSTLSPDHPESEVAIKRKNSFVGTAEYVSPEMLTNKKASSSSDLWAFGCIIYQMITAAPPFTAANEYLIFQKIMKLEYDKSCDKLTGPTTSLIENLLQIEPTARIGVNDDLKTSGYKSIRNHPFFAPLQSRFSTLHTENALSILSQTSSRELSQKNNRSFEEPSSCIGEPGLDERQIRRLLGLALYDDSDVKRKHKQTNMLDIKPDEMSFKTEIQKKENPWHKFVDNNLILKQGFLDKKKGLFARRRMFLLTTGPHLYYVDPVNKVLKGQIPWSRELRPEPKNFKIFFVHTPNRIYYLEDPEGNANEWCKFISEVKSAAYHQERNSTSD